MDTDQVEKIDVEEELSNLYRLQYERVSRDLKLEDQMPKSLASLQPEFRLLYDFLALLYEVQSK